jgi:hypothetical protein
MEATTEATGAAPTGTMAPTKEHAHLKRDPVEKEPAKHGIYPIYFDIKSTWNGAQRVGLQTQTMITGLLLILQHQEEQQHLIHLL